MNILFTPITSSSIAHIIRSFALAEEFEKDNHKVFFTSCLLKKDFIQSKGYEVVETYHPFNLNDEEDQSVNYLSSHKKEMVDWFKAEINASEKVGADVVISSPAFFGSHVTLATGIPTVSLMNGQYLPSSKGLMGLSLAKDTLKNALLRSLLRPIFKKEFIKKYLSEVLDVYRLIGIENNIKTQEDLYSQMPILIPGDEEFEPQRYLDEKTKFVGPLFWNGFERIDGNLTEEAIKEFKGNDKLIFLTFGGSVFNKEVYDRILKGMEEVEAKVIVALGPNFDRKSFPDDSERLMIRNFVPGLRVSKLSDVIVNTGSQGAIMQALCNGKPVVAFPVGIDQAYFANRLEEMGVGINVNKIRITGFSKRESYQFVDNSIPENMVKAVLRILKESKYSDSAREYSERLLRRHPDPAREIVDFIYKNYGGK
ncbi:hypothetical protein H6763_04345 [Candidatus Nomurabacteria bacterium]|uniref:Glycosyl transferase family 28 C-terminal domain-containing protein n=1 Tax=Candidatus Dojkabacteria bacterium TaxID=2099670 RepID=A0A955I2Y5_9BACT|nr:hypothetical protein [Candidatus Dojkabacteria bacterium]MCB9789675.1 hypothetical protein [Candidatus Nomurabacteria bacterium]MCB9804022.1 hypothetical protein [Candidatus Nomurabacteria bacterium]